MDEQENLANLFDSAQPVAEKQQTENKVVVPVNNQIAPVDEDLGALFEQAAPIQETQQIDTPQTPHDDPIEAHRPQGIDDNSWEDIKGRVGKILGAFEAVATSIPREGYKQVKDFVDYSNSGFEKVKHAQASKENLEFEFKELKDELSTFVTGDKEAAERIKVKREKINNSVASFLQGQGMDVYNDKGKLVFIEKDKDGKEHIRDLDESTFKNISHGFLASLGEIGLGIEGATGAALGVQRIIPPTTSPVVRAGMTVAAGAAGGYAGTTVGSVFDLVGQSIELNEKINAKDIFEKATARAVGDLTVATGLTPIIKVIAKTYKSIRGIPAATKKKMLNEATQNVKQDALDILVFAEENGIELTPSQLSDSKVIEQVTTIMNRNSFIREKFNKINSEQLAIVADAYEKTKIKLGKSPTKISDLETADPFGESIGKSLKEAKTGRDEEVRQAYSEFEDKVSGNIKTKKDEVQKSINETRAKYDDDINEVVKKVLDKTEQTAEKVFKNGDTDLKGLHTLEKKLYEIASNLPYEEKTAKKAVLEVRGKLSKQMEQMAAEEGDDVALALAKAKQKFKNKENIYGFKSKHKDIAKVLETEETETIVKKLLTGENAKTNARILKQELSRTYDGRKLIKPLARRILEEVEGRVTKEVQALSDVSKKTSSEKLINITKLLDDDVFKVFADDETLKMVHNIGSMAATIRKQEKMVKGSGAPIQSQGVVKVLDLALNRILNLFQANTVGKVLTSSLPQKVVTKMLKGTKIATMKNGESAGIKIINESIQDLDKTELKGVNEKAIIGRARKLREEANLKKKAKIKEDELKKKEAISRKEFKERKEQKQKEFHKKKWEEAKAERQKEIEAQKELKNTKVVDKKGKPLTVYHGTTKDFKVFDSSKIGSSTDSGVYGKGIYFTADKEEAKFYSKDKNVLEVQLDVKNPYIINSKSDIPKIDIDLKTLDDMENADVKYSEEFTKYLKSKGYDGVINNIRKKNGEIVVFDTKQIKIIPKKEIISKKPLSEQAQKIKEASEPKINGSEEEAKQEVKNMFAKNKSEEARLKSMSKDDIKELDRQEAEALAQEANKVFVKGADNLLVGTVAGFGEDENGNITFDPEKFVIGLGGYTAVKALAKNKTIQKEFREYADRALTELENKKGFNYLSGKQEIFAGEKASKANEKNLIHKKEK